MKIIKQVFLLKLMILFLIISSCKSENEKQDPTPSTNKKDNVKYIDGPYVFHEEGKLRIITVNQHDEIEEELVDHVDSLLVQIPNHTPNKFYVKLHDDLTPPPSSYDSKSKILAISDIEGNFYAFSNLLIGNKIVDENLNWTFGDGHLVLNGDFVDRGEYVTQVLWLIYKLEREAKNAGGMVHFIIGNHEAMNLEGDFRYVVKKYKKLIERLGMHELSFYNSKNETGRWLRSKNIIEKIDNNIFVHAGISPLLLRKSLEMDKMNNIAQNYYGFDLSSKDTLSLQGTIFGSYGPLWYRGLVKDYKYYAKSTIKEVDAFLSYYNAERVIIGHSIVDDISLDYNGKVVRIDIHHPLNDDAPEESKALFIKNNKVYKTNFKGENIEIE